METEPKPPRSSLMPQPGKPKPMTSSARMAAVALRIVLAGVFLYAGLIKAYHPFDFVGDLRGFRLFPEASILPIASYLPFVEIVVGGALLSGVFNSGALLLSGGLLFVFGGLIVSAIIRKLDISCGCFGHGGAASSLPMSLLHDVILLSVWACLALLWTRNGRDTRSKALSS